MTTISVCMIVKNEEKHLARCLSSLQGIWDELIIVDTGSTDKTKNIAAEYTSHVYDYQWTHDFAHARNYTFSLATCDYIYTPAAVGLVKNFDIAVIHHRLQTHGFMYGVDPLECPEPFEKFWTIVFIKVFCCLVRMPVYINHLDDFDFWEKGLL